MFVYYITSEGDSREQPPPYIPPPAPARGQNYYCPRKGAKLLLSPQGGKIITIPARCKIMV